MENQIVPNRIRDRCDILEYIQRSWLILLFGFILFCAGLLVLLNNEVNQTLFRVMNF